MATLGNIRKHGVLLLVVVCAAMLAFILGDFLTSSNSYFNRKREYVGVIEGQKIHYTDYEAAKEQITEVYKLENNRSDIDEDLAANLRNQAWQMMLVDYTLSKQANEIGMTITSDELKDICLGENIHPFIRSRFSDANGNFNRMALLNFLSNLDQEVEGENAADMQKYKNYWMYCEKVVRISYLQEKYNDLLVNCITANKLDAKYAFDAKQNTVDVQYVMKPYMAVADDQVTVSDADIKALYKKQMPRFEQEPNRTIAYIAFPIVPSQDDFKDAEEALKKIQHEFNTTEDVMTVVNLNSDVMYDGRHYSATTIPAEYKDFAFAAGAKAGDTTAIKFENNTYSMARLVEAGYSRPDSVLLTAVIPQEGKADSLSEIGWLTEEVLPKDLAEKAFTAKKGDKITVSMGMGEQEFIVTNISAASPRVKLAIVARNVTPSSRTYSTIYNEAKQFIVNHKNEADFQNGAREAAISVMPATVFAMTDKVANLKNSRPIVRWAFEAKDGQVSDVFECGDQLIVAALTDISEGEYRSLESVTNELRFQAINDKKAELIAAQLADAKTLEQALTILEADTIRTIEHVSLASYSFGSSNEPAVIGAALRLAENETSAPVKGLQGVYVLRATNKATAPGEMNEDAEIAQLNARVSYYIPRQALALIEKKADVVDNRPNFQ